MVNVDYREQIAIVHNLQMASVHTKDYFTEVKIREIEKLVDDGNEAQEAAQYIEELIAAAID